jgi:protein-L-isoaspartate O-methyltransferase
LAERVIDLAEIPVADPDLRVLEPSAGTGALIEAMNFCGGTLVAVEINVSLAESLRQRFQAVDVRCSDFLSCNGDLGTFDRIIMNPPFQNGADIEHIEHARKFLKPGGRLVAICANGPRQRERLMSEADEWIDLEPGTFKESGTMVNAALLVFVRPADDSLDLWNSIR